MSQPRHIDSVMPFKQWAEKYFEKGFIPIPLPPGRKNPPPGGWTGHGRPTPDLAQLQVWLSNSDPAIRYPISKANIALRLNTIDDEYDLVGIDVDHHPEDINDPKNGGPQLESFEKKLGKLPPTWTSSARTNGIAGIRIYRAPKGLAWRGDLGPGGHDIDIISKNYRFMVVFPSTNPDARDAQYWWYPPGHPPNGNVPNGFGPIPDLSDIPLLPDKWVEYCTQGYTKDVGVPMDMDISEKALDQWAKTNFAPNDVLCEYMELTLAKWVDKLDNSAKSHNVLTSAFNHMLRCGATEGHKGWRKAAIEFQKHYVATVLERGKRRTESEAKSEARRSYFGALRRIKGEADISSAYFATDDACDMLANQAGPITEPEEDDGGWPKTPAKNVDEYERNDDGNAMHFLDLHQGILYYVPNVLRNWIIWNGDRWVVDELSSIAPYLYRRVKERQMVYAAKLFADYQAVAGASGSAELKKLAGQWITHARKSGQIRDIERALESARNVREGISISYEQLDSDRRALGCANGVVRINESGKIEIFERDKSLLITRNTGVPYIPLKHQKTRGKRLFKDFLDKFIAPSLDIRYFQKLCGSTLIGNNEEKMAMFFWGRTDTGKTTMLELMIRALGDYGGVRNPDIFKSVRLNPALGSSLTLRIMGVSELGDNEINSELFKNITGGEKITVELKGSNNLVSGIPQFTPIITTNSVPRVPGEDSAFRNRLRVIEFKHQASEEEKSSGNQAVLAWLIEGAAMYTREGLTPIPAEIVMATEEFASEVSDIGDFVSDCIVADGDGFVRNADLMQHFRQWADSVNVDVRGWSQTRLTQKLKGLGFEYSRIRNGRGFKGIKLVEFGLEDVTPEPKSESK